MGAFLSKITTGRKGRAQKVVIYAPEGFGKSTLASQFPDPLFLDVEDSTAQLDVRRLSREELPNLSSFESALSEITTSRACQTLVVDTADWLEQMVLEAIIAEANNKKITGIEDFGYGKGYVILKERFTVLLAAFDKAIAAGLNVVLLAHAKVVKFEPPDGAGPFDRYELKLSKHVAPLLKEWADMLLFGNWRTQVREKDKNEAGQQFKGVGGRDRVLYANRCASWDAKNRHGMGDSEKWEINVIEKAFRAVGAPWSTVKQSEPESAPQNTSAPVAEVATPPLVEPPPAKESSPAAPSSAPDPEAVELARICEPHSDTINHYLVSNSKVATGQTWRDVSSDYRRRILRNPAGFLKVATAGKAVAA